MTRRLFGLALLGAALGILVGTFLVVMGAGMRELHATDCNNHFALNAADADCRTPLWMMCGGAASIATSLAGIVVAIISRLRR
jgi:hypothetical protein